ncbi:MAG TPA: LuxR C-terminal-related transcriptional regulator, partial [Anaerolineales bacterium]|nr:LuxR C-terminal-related transcriptional regulator [Anaerolineales bacterium]
AIPMIYQGEVAIVMDWFDKLPEALVQHSPMMCISKAWALALMQHPTRGQELAQAIREADLALNLSNAGEALRNLVAGHAASIQAYVMQGASLNRAEAGKLIEMAQRARRLLPENEKAIHSVNALLIGYGHVALADFAPAEKAYAQAFEDGIAGGNFYAGVYGAIYLVVMAIMKGQLKDASQMCLTYIDQFNRFVAGQRFPPIGDLYSVKGSLLLEENRLVEAEEALMHGLSLIHLTAEYEAHIRGYSALARLRFIQGNQAGMQESLSFFEGNRKESDLYGQALRHRFSVHGALVNETILEEARHWITPFSTRFHSLPDIDSADLVNRLRYLTYLGAAHVLIRLAVRNPQAYSLRNVHDYFVRQEKFAEAHKFLGWSIEIWILRALAYHVEGKPNDAHRIILSALEAAAPRGYFRIFLDEADLMRPLLESMESRVKDNDLSVFVERLLDAMPGESIQAKTHLPHEALLTDRELEVLRLLVAGESYKEMGQKLFLSLNTVQFHVKSIYRKLSVNKRVQAIRKAQEMKLI